jgi:aspartate aminotransferase-like enzyme
MEAVLMTERFGTFFLPGPTEVRRDVLHAMTGPMIPHRGRTFEELFARLQEGLRVVFRTQRPVFVSTSSATGLMEAGIRCAPPGPVLALVNGAFSERFEQIARGCGRDVESITAEWGKTVPLEHIEQRLAARQFSVVTVVHSETSTGVLTDVRAISDLAHRHGAMALVDSVTGVAGAPLEFDEWEMDYVLTGSQKALALPPGLAFVAASGRFMRSAATAEARGMYFDLVEFEQFASKNQTPNTPAVSLLYALDVQLRAILAEGISARWARHQAMRATVEHWAGATGQRILAAAGERAPTVSAIIPPHGVQPSSVVSGAEARGFTIGGGYGRLREQTYRIGHMGDHTVVGLEACLEACEAAIAESQSATGRASNARGD